MDQPNLSGRSIRCATSRSVRGALRSPPSVLRRSLRPSVCGLVLFSLLALVFFPGCTLLKNPLKEKINADNVYGRAGRLAKDGMDVTLGPMEGQADFDKAKALFDEAATAHQAAKDAAKTDKASPAAVQKEAAAQEKYAQAMRVFKSLRKKYKDKPIEEDIMFYLGECYYEQGYYPYAQDTYDELLDKYTSSRYVEPITRRMFFIAQLWLRQPKSAENIERVAFTAEKGDKPVEPAKLPPYAATLLPNVSDRTRPLFDPEGRAEKALKSIWLKDPTGPLADDALMVAATHHMRRHNFKEADDLFNIIRLEYPQSEHSQNAHLLGSHVKLLTYQGASYDETQLDEASKLIDSTLRIYPDIAERDRLQKKLAGTKEAAAARKWAMVEFYQRKGARKSIELYCVFILRDHPESEYAVRAARLLNQMNPQKTVAKKTTPLEQAFEGMSDELDEIPDETDGVTVETGLPEGRVPVDADAFDVDAVDAGDEAEPGSGRASVSDSEEAP